MSIEEMNGQRMIVELEESKSPSEQGQQEEAGSLNVELGGDSDGVDVRDSVLVEDADDDLLSSSGSDDRRLFVQDPRDDDYLRTIAEGLVQRKENPYVEVRYERDVYPLFDDHSSLEHNVAIENYRQCVCKDPAMLQRSFSEFMAHLRSFLESRHGRLKFASQEILLSIVPLDLVVCEDNVYNSQISLADVVNIFEILQTRSREAEEREIPKHLDMEVSTRPRFVSRYNTLVELTEGKATLSNVRPFSNDESHPLVLDDDQPVKVINSKQNTSTVDNNDSDELLEILSE